MQEGSLVPHPSRLRLLSHGLSRALEQCVGCYDSHQALTMLGFPDAPDLQMQSPPKAAAHYGAPVNKP
jgi:hypothetical protein